MWRLTQRSSSGGSSQSHLFFLAYFAKSRTAEKAEKNRNEKFWGLRSLNQANIRTDGGNVSNSAAQKGELLGGEEAPPRSSSPRSRTSTSSNTAIAASESTEQKTSSPINPARDSIRKNTTSVSQW